MVAPGSPAAAVTPFRAAEKAYQLHREELTRSGAYGGGDESTTAQSVAPRRRGRGRFRVRPLDLSAVLDVGALAAEEAAAEEAAAQQRSDAPSVPPPPLQPRGGARRGATRVAVSPAVAAPVYALDGHPGFFVVVGALSTEEQARFSSVPHDCC
jgi:hypothetical protein